MPKKYFENREVSWLKFNYRVLEEARDNSVPLLERLTFASIFLTNLDEFYRVRVGALVRQALDDDSKRDARTGMRPSKQLVEVYKRTRTLFELFDRTFEDIEAGLAFKGIVRKQFSKLTDGEKTFCASFADHEIKRQVKVHENGKSFFAENGKVYYAFLCEGNIYILDYTGAHSRMVTINGSESSYILLDELIIKYASDIIKKKVTSSCTFRLTRSAALDLDTDYASDRGRREEMLKLVERRRKLPPVRVEIGGCKDKAFRDQLCRLLRVSDEITFERVSPLCLDYTGGLRDSCKGREELFYAPQSPQQSRYIDRDSTMISQIEKRDILLFYPYEDIADFIRLLDEAGEDKDVKSISITLYRAAHESRIIESLCKAAQNGKQVLALVELRARFDEENNIIKADKLEAAGCQVIFGRPHVKVHSKLCLISYEKDGQTRYITQIGTGNYNEKTSRIYTDLSLMTADNTIAEDAEAVFEALKESRLVESSNELLISPLCIKSRLIDLMDAEITAAKAGGEGYIGAKVNSLTDKQMIKKLVECGRAGVKVELVVRGICCLIPGIEGKTDNIKVVSIVGRYLEHSRIYIFGSAARRKVYISSADFMTRNLSRRVEAAAPVRDEELRDRVVAYFEAQISDRVRGRVLCPDGIYRREQYDEAEKDSQQLSYEEAVKNVPLKPTPALQVQKAEQLTQTEIRQSYDEAQTVPLDIQPEKPHKRGFIAWLRGLFGK